MIFLFFCFLFFFVLFFFVFFFFFLLYNNLCGFVRLGVFFFKFDTFEKKIFFPFFFFFPFNFVSLWSVSFEKLYAPYTNKSHDGYSVVQSYQSGYIITGTLNEIPWNQSLLLMKINPDGDVIWTKTMD